MLQVDGHFLNYCFPSILDHSIFLALFHMLMSRRYRLCADTVMLVISVVGISAGHIHSPSNAALDTLLGLMIFDTILKLTVVGPKRLWTFPLHRCDICMTVLAVVFLLVSVDEISIGLPVERCILA